MGKTIKMLYNKPGRGPVGSWFVKTQNLGEWHIAFLENDIITAKNGPGEEFYYESWETLKDVAYAVDKDGFNWTLLETKDALYAIREDFDRFGEESPL